MRIKRLYYHASTIFNFTSNKSLWLCPYKSVLDGDWDYTPNLLESKSSAYLYVNQIGLLFNIPVYEDALSLYPYYECDLLRGESIVMLPISNYQHIDEYYHSFFHELAHSTSQPYRCGRFTSGKRVSRSQEESIADLAAGIICTILGYTIDTVNIGRYINAYHNYGPIPQEEQRLILRQAVKAARYILNRMGDV